MPKIFSDYEKQQWADEYRAGTCVREICRRYHVSKNTVYKYINLFDARSSKRSMEISGHKILTLEQQNAHLKEIIAVSKECQCGAAAPRAEKLQAAERLEGKFSMRAICEYLDLSRGTYYNYKRAKTKVKVDAARDEFFRPLVKRVFKESGERFGAAPIRHRLSDCLQGMLRICYVAVLTCLQYSKSTNKR